MTFKIVMSDSISLKKIFEAVESVVEETVIKFDASGLRITNIDAGRVALIDLFVSAEDFDEYKFKSDSTIGLNVTDLRKILGRSTKDDRVTLFYKDETPDLVIQMDKEDDGKKRKFTIRLKDISMPPIKPETLDAISFGNHFELDSEVLAEALRDCEIYSDTIELSVKEKEVIFSAFSNAGEMITNIDVDYGILRNYTFSEDAECTYALRHFNNALKMTNLPNVGAFIIYTKQDQPAKIEFTLFENSFAKYYIAPRIDGDEDEY